MRYSKWLNLSGDGDLLVALVPQWTLAAVRVVKCDGDGCLGDARLPSLVHQLLQTPCPHLQYSEVGSDYNMP